MVGFRNAVGSAPLTDWSAPAPMQVAFGRGAAGSVALNNGDAPWAAAFATRLADGVYCDVVGGASVGGECTGSA